MITKEKILEEIKRTTKENGGKPLGIKGFEKETAIKPYDWQRYWARFGEAVKEAGFTSNLLTPAFTDNFLSEKIIEVMRKSGKFPTYTELRLEKIKDIKFPNWQSFLRLGNKQELVLKITEYCKNKNSYEDIIKLCEEILKKTDEQENFENKSKEVLGAVYLFKHGKYYKIGKTNDTVRRGNELKIQLPENLDLIHEIKTYDPSGVEAYWHRRFESKRMNGEWFDLSASEIKEFKHWKKIY